MKLLPRVKETRILCIIAIFFSTLAFILLFSYAGVSSPQSIMSNPIYAAKTSEDLLISFGVFAAIAQGINIIICIACYTFDIFVEDNEHLTQTSVIRWVSIINLALFGLIVSSLLLWMLTVFQKKVIRSNELRELEKNKSKDF